MESPKAQAEPVVDVEEWTRALTDVWNPKSIRDIRLRANGGQLFIAELASGETLHLGVQSQGVDMCALWSGDVYVLWDSVISFCSTFPEPEMQRPLKTQMRSLLRRNLYLMGVKVDASDEEKSQWQQEPW